MYRFILEEDADDDFDPAFAWDAAIEDWNEDTSGRCEVKKSRRLLDCLADALICALDCLIAWLRG